MKAKRERATYQKAYHEKNAEAARERKRAEDYRRRRAAAYWRFKYYLDRTLPDLLNGISPEIIDQERDKYLAGLAEPVEVVNSE